MSVVIQDLKKAYGQKLVLDIPTLSIQEGEIVGIVGNNGAGKTTLFSLILDLIKSTKGTVESNGIIVHESEDWKKYTGSFLSESFLIDFLSPEEYFGFISSLHNWNDQDLKNFLAQFEDFFQGEVLQQKKYIRDLSKGNQKKVGIVGALIGDPKLIILDEPFANLDPSTQSRLKKLIEQLDNDGKTILISSHDINHIAEVCTRIVVLDHGKVIKDLEKNEATISELKSYFAV